MTNRVLSELEGVCLGLLAKRGPCTTYLVRQELKAAPSSHWQASTGSVYPLLARLEAAGLIATTSDKGDGRGRKLLRITSTGKTALKKWVLAGFGPDLISSVTDPVRSRTFFLDVLSAAQQTTYLDKLEKEMERYVEKTKTHLKTISKQEDKCGYLGALGAVKTAEARLQWLRVVQKEIIQ